MNNSRRRFKLDNWFFAALGLGVDEISVASSTRPSIQKLQSLGVLWPAQVDRICEEQNRVRFLVQDFLPAKSIGIMAGESTIGKSPLICQLGLCVAAGLPFLGMPTEQGPVLYFDLENSLLDCKSMRDSIKQFLDLVETPQDFLLMQEPPRDLEHWVDEVKPKLVLIDSLRAFRPDVTEKNRAAAEWLMRIRSLTRKYDCSFLIVHHLRKPTKDAPTTNDLDSCKAADWLLAMEGPRAFVNQTDVRVAVAEGDGNPASLRLKWSVRIRGDSPLVQVERVFNGDDEAVGYRHMTGAGLLSADKRAAFERLPNEFSTSDAKDVRRVIGLGDGNDPTNKFLAECRHLRIVEKLERGRWRKVAA